MTSDLASKCRTCLSDSNFFHQLFDYVDENYKILDMLDGIVPQIDIKCNTQFSSLVCQSCVDKLLIGYKFQQLCIESNNRLHDLHGIAVFETEPKLENVLDPLTGEINLKMKQEVVDDVSYEPEINSEEMGLSMKTENDNDWSPQASSGSDTDSSNEKLSVLKERSVKKSSLKVEHIERLNKIKIQIKSFHCQECGKVLSSHYYLKRHMTLMHTAEKPLYPCETCNITFAAETTLKAHILTHKIEQNYCDNLKTGHKEDSDNNDKNESNACREDNIEKIISEELLKFQCPDCSKCFEKKASLSAHYKVHKKKHKEKLNDTSSKVQKTKTSETYDNTDENEQKLCVKEEFPITSEIFEKPMEEFETNEELLNNVNEDSDDDSDKDLFAKPVKNTKNVDFIDTGIGEIEKPNTSNKRTGNFTCEVCGKIFDRPYRLKRHSAVHSLARPHECEICKYRFATVNILKAHLIQHENDTFTNLWSQSRPEGFKCPDCPRRFEKQASLSAHRQTHTRNALESNYPCMVCQRNFMSVRSLTEHITNKHPEVERHKCDQCDKTFVLHAHLVEHLNRHKGNKNLVCLICEKEFGYANTLKEHMRKHSGESPYLCPQCGKTFRSASNLRQHMERHIGLKKYQCLECPSRFNCRSDLIKHTSTHTNAKPHVCDICGSRFTRAYSLRKHKLKHSGERPFKCDQCNMTFAIVYHLRRHMRTHTGEKPYKCKYCERAYAESGDLTKHLRTHVGENTYMCDQCPMAFKYQTELRQHQSEHYKMAQRLLQQAQKMSDEAQRHEINDNQNIQQPSINDISQRQISMPDTQNHQMMKADQSHPLPLSIVSSYTQQMPFINHSQQQLSILERGGEQHNQQNNNENIITRQDNLDIKNLGN